MENKIKAYKGFDMSLRCRGFQYEVGKEYDHPGPVRVCESGFNACENPMDVLGFYPPCGENGNPNRFCEVEQSGEIDKSQSDKKCSSHIRILAEIGLDGLIKAGVKFILDKANWKDKKRVEHRRRLRGNEHRRPLRGSSKRRRVHSYRDRLRQSS